MRVFVSDFYTDIKLEPAEMKALCRPGEGADTCIWLLVAPGGFECSIFHKPHVLVDRWMRGETVAKRDGCDFMRDKSFFGQEGETTIPWP